MTIASPLTAASSAASFTVATAVPTITSFTPTSGPVGTSVTITGTNFTGATSVTFNNVAATFTPPVTSTQITATVPSTATTGPIRVVTPGGTAVSATNFTVTGGGAQHARTATFQLSGHLKGSGSVSVSDGFTDCIKNVPVKLQVQKSGGWKSLETLSTNSSGSFFGYLPNKSGKYRAKLGNFTLLTGATCGADASPSRTYHK